MGPQADIASNRLYAKFRKLLLEGSKLKLPVVPRRSLSDLARIGNFSTIFIDVDSPSRPVSMWPPCPWRIDIVASFERHVTMLHW